MPNTKTAKKRMRQGEARNEKNRQQRSTLRTAIKKVRTAPNAEEANKLMGDAEKLLDRAARTNLVHPNAAARTKSRLRRGIAGS